MSRQRFLSWVRSAYHAFLLGWGFHAPVRELTAEEMKEYTDASKRSGDARDKETTRTHEQTTAAASPQDRPICEASTSEE